MEKKNIYIYICMYIYIYVCVFSEYCKHIEKLQTTEQKKYKNKKLETD